MDNNKKTTGTVSMQEVQAPTSFKTGRNWVTAERARDFNLPPQGPEESDFAFRDRVSGTLRSMGHTIEAHEAATGKLYNEGGENPLEDPMTGIFGAIAQGMQGTNYPTNTGSDQIGLDIAAGVHATNKHRGALDGLTPELAIMVCALFGGR